MLNKKTIQTIIKNLFNKYPNLQITQTTIKTQTMKKLIKSVLMLSIASLVVLSSCEDPDAETVTPVEIIITPNPSTATLSQGAVLTLTLELKGNSGNKLKKLTVTSSAANVALVSKTLSSTTATEIVRDTIKTVGSITYTVVLEGEKGTPVTKTYVVTGTQAPGELDVTPNSRDLKGQTQDSLASFFLELVNPFTPFNRARQTFSNNKTDIDLVFYFGNTDKATIASPTDSRMQTVYTYIDWTGAKATQFFKTALTAANYDAIVTSNSDAQIITLAGGVTTWGTSATNLVAGNVVLYKTKEGVLGLIKVETLNGTQANDAEIGLSVASQD